MFKGISAILYFTNEKIVHDLLHFQAKKAAEGQDRWLLVNLQSKGEFNSHLVCFTHPFNMCDT